MECTDIFWHAFYKAYGITLGMLLPVILGFGVALLTIFLTIFRLQHRHEEAMQATRLRHEEALQESRTREYQVRDSHYRVIQGGQG
jgi:hypothetical protein